MIDDPNSFDAASILAEQNLEVRRAMIERVGYERFLTGCDAELVSQDDHGRLWRIDLPDDEPLVLVEVENATLEPDGSRKRYFLRVPPDIRRAQQAVAWTFGLDAHTYRPDAAT